MTTDKKPHATKRTKAQKESDRNFVAGLLVKCIPIREITRELNAKNESEGRGYTLSFQQVHYDIKLIFEEWKEQKAAFLETKIELELAKLDKIESECWEAWERSKEGKQKTVIEGGLLQGGAMSGGELRLREIETTFGDTKFLDIIQKCMDRRAALLGLNAPTKIMTASVGVGGDITKEEIEREIEEKWKILS